LSKITFRADDDLVHRLDSFDASKSAVMREALREYLDGPDGPERTQTARKQPLDADSSIDALFAERVDALISERLSEVTGSKGPQDINVNIALEGSNADSATVPDEGHSDRKTVDREPTPASDTGHKTCNGCGEDLGPDHVYCPNCGEKTSKPFCECGEELRSDWLFCPTCGARTPAADVLDKG
jgi:hypothetical protein